MDVMTVFVLLAVAATLVALASGIATMASGHEIGHYDGVQWMKWRVGAQAIAFALILLALLKGH